MRAFFRLSFCLLPFLLSSCASIQQEPVQKDINPPANVQPIMHLQASGEQIFRCVHDMKGWFWRFEAPNAYLFNPTNGQAVAKHGYRFSFVHNDGSQIVSSRITKIGASDGKNLADALFTVTARAHSGSFAKVSYVQRINAKGGIPQVKCTPAREGQINRVPFEADFIFWR